MIPFSVYHSEKCGSCIRLRLWDLCSMNSFDPHTGYNCKVDHKRLLASHKCLKLAKVDEKLTVSR